MSRRTRRIAALASRVVASTAGVLPRRSPDATNCICTQVTPRDESRHRSGGACTRPPNSRACTHRARDAGGSAAPASGRPDTRNRVPSSPPRVADQQQPEVAALRQPKPANDRRIDAVALGFQESIEARGLLHRVEACVEGVPGAVGRSGLAIQGGGCSSGQSTEVDRSCRSLGRDQEGLLPYTGRDGRSGPTPRTAYRRTCIAARVAAGAPLSSHP